MSSTPVRRDQSKIRSASGAPHTGNMNPASLETYSRMAKIIGRTKCKR